MEERKTYKMWRGGKRMERGLGEKKKWAKDYRGDLKWSEGVIVGVKGSNNPSAPGVSLEQQSYITRKASLGPTGEQGICVPGA